MKKLLTSFIVLLLLIGGCTKESDVKVSSSSPLTKSSEATEKLKAFVNEHPQLLPILKARSEQFMSPQNKAGKTTLSTKNADYSYYHFLVQKATDPDPECGPTEIDGYINTSVATWTEDDWYFYGSFWYIPFDAAYVFDNTNGGQYYGSTGQFSNVLNRNFKDLLKFWDIPTDILMRDCHGNIFKNEEKVADLLMVYGIPDFTEEDAAFLAAILDEAFGSDGFMNYTHPLLTFNAFAAMADPNFGAPKKIVMGDGIMQAYKDLGYGDIAPQAILAHEFGHQVQFANNVAFPQFPTAAETRRTELMADAFSAYFLTHKKGAAANWKRVQEFLKVFYDIGDCYTDDPGHHGTPSQRMRAAAYGYKLASDAKIQGKILSSADFITAFDAALAGIIGPD